MTDYKKKYLDTFFYWQLSYTKLRNEYNELKKKYEQLLKKLEELEKK